MPPLGQGNTALSQEPNQIKSIFIVHNKCVKKQMFIMIHAYENDFFFLTCKLNHLWRNVHFISVHLSNFLSLSLSHTQTHTHTHTHRQSSTCWLTYILASFVLFLKLVCQPKERCKPEKNQTDKNGNNKTTEWSIHSSQATQLLSPLINDKDTQRYITSLAWAV